LAAATILQIIPRLDTGGAELATLEIALALKDAGARALVASEGGRLALALAGAGGELIPFPAATKNPFAMWANARALERLVGREGVGLLHARSRAPAWSALIAARRAGVPFVTTYHGAYGTELPFKNFYNSVMARGDLVIANSRFTAELISVRHGTPEERLRVIHRGGVERVAALRKSWGGGAKTRIVLHAARLTGWKGQRVVIEAARRLAEEGRLGDTVFVLAGDPQGREAYAAALAGALAQALALKPAARAAMGARARRHVAANFSLERMRRATLAVYDELLGTGLARAVAPAPAAKGSRRGAARSP